MIIRTVLDITRASHKHLRLTLLLAASYHHFNALQKELTMEVWVIGQRLPSLESFLEALGIRIVYVPLAATAQVVRTSNKIPASDTGVSGRPILLLDNDILCTGSLDELLHTATLSIMGTEAGVLRIQDAQWEEIEKKTGRKTLFRRYLALRDYPACRGAAMFRNEQAFEKQRLYVNTGVLLIPTGLRLREIWEDHLVSIVELFKGHPLTSDAVAGCDQASFATALGQIGSFDWLPIGYNYRPQCFILGLVPSEQIRLVHLAGAIRRGPGGRNPANDPSLTVTRHIALYWHSRILSELEKLASRCSADAIAQRRTIAEQTQSVGIAIAERYRLNAAYAQCVQELESARP